ncbi:TRAP transporter large permease [Novispirillum itersonii]|uniref:TRAP transporter large permease protein n=1 Tax=Novispirillum itersonii TaxID=189 RepID=A0A7W9ZGF3_NOVIT|nr:TRAP transporter large permease subunit [Novispirillum itersonii]MBB6209589.1 tripartite ATP-independent transporter DctM subunit [Novispirillum itersonii]
MSEMLLAAIISLVALFGFLGLGTWVAFSLLGVGAVCMALFSNAPLGTSLASTLWGGANQWSLASLPLFLWMGEILFRSRLSSDMFAGLAPWMTRLPGRLLHVNVFGCGIFAAVSGSSAATAATIGKISLPELLKRGYPENMVLGTLAGSATLGLLIPPSIIMIVYGVATDQSIARLFMAGVIPGLLLLALFVGYVVVWSLINRHRLPQEDAVPVTWADRILAIKRLGPVFILIGGVIGSIYSGIASPTDAAAVGVAIALVLARVSGDLNWKTFKAGLTGATQMSCMIAFILAGANFLTTAMGYTGIPAGLAQWVAELHLSPYALLAALTVLFIILGCFLDGISMVVLTTSVILPMVLAAGIDPIWFGIYLVFVVEMAQITPPVGFNLFVIQSLTNRNIFTIAMATLPFFLIMAGALVLITIIPDIALWLPNQM